MSKTPLIKDEIKQIVHQYNSNPENLISILQEIQRKYNYLPEGAFSFLAEDLRMAESKIYGIATFYTQFKFIKPGKHQIKVCMGTACHVKESDELLYMIELELGIKPGQTTENKLVSLERVACLGCCALSPTVVIDGRVYGKMTKERLKRIFSDLKK